MVTLLGIRWLRVGFECGVVFLYCVLKLCHLWNDPALENMHTHALKCSSMDTIITNEMEKGSTEIQNKRQKTCGWFFLCYILAHLTYATMYSVMNFMLIISFSLRQYCNVLHNMYNLSCMSGIIQTDVRLFIDTDKDETDKDRTNYVLERLFFKGMVKLLFSSHAYGEDAFC